WVHQQVMAYDVILGQHGKAFQVASEKSLTKGERVSAPAKSGTPEEAEAPHAEASLEAQIKELLLGYDERTAMEIAKKFTVEELESALALVSAAPKGQDRKSLRKVLYIAWAELDPHAAWRAILVDPLDENEGLLLSAIAGLLVKTDPLGAIDSAMSLRAGKRRSAAMNKVFENWSKNDVSAAVAYTNAHPEMQIELLSFSQGLENLANVDPLKAANLALSIKGLESRSSILSGLMQAWVERDPAAAFKWAEALSNTELREDTTAFAVKAWAKSDPKAALNYAQGLTDGDTRIKSFSSAWNDWLYDSPEAAISYLRTITDEKLLGTVRGHISSYAGSLSSKDRLTLLALVPESQTKQQIYSSTASSLTWEGQFNEALVMLNSMSDSSGRDRQVTQFAQTWAKEDFAAATAWLKIQPDSSDRDLALTGYSFALAATDPAAAIQWVNSIPDKAVRRDAQKLIAFRWYQTDPAQTEAWMTGSSGFSEKDIEFVRFKAKVPGDYLPLTPTVGQRR
ncbi:MAG: hypothetical protein NTV80_13935, partial [Verrucomicrobia bacterium]|nr:hypothetical protein [Verrucomicrobiota bacterium]